MVKKGWLSIENLSVLKSDEFWFVLATETLTWFKDKDVRCFCFCLCPRAQRRLDHFFPLEGHMYACMCVCAQEKETKFMLPLEGLRLRENTSSKKYKFSIGYNQSGGTRCAIAGEPGLPRLLPPAHPNATRELVSWLKNATMLLARRFVYKELKQLDLSTESNEELENWKSAFNRAGVFSDEKKRFSNTDSATAVYARAQDEGVRTFHSTEYSTSN